MIHIEGKGTMQDRYAGDIGDYGKIALLRELQSQGLSVAVNWYLVEPLESEKKADGTYKQEDGKYIVSNTFHYYAPDRYTVMESGCVYSKNAGLYGSEGGADRL